MRHVDPCMKAGVRVRVRSKGRGLGTNTGPGVDSRVVGRVPAVGKDRAREDGRKIRVRKDREGERLEIHDVAHLVEDRDGSRHACSRLCARRDAYTRLCLALYRPVAVFRIARHEMLGVRPAHCHRVREFLPFQCLDFAIFRRRCLFRLGCNH